MQISIDPNELAPVITATITGTLEAMRNDQTRLGDRLAFREAEAARMLGLESHQLRDERLRGRIGASSVVGRGVRYTREDLLVYLARNRSEPRI